MNLKLLVVLVIIVISLPAHAVNCERRPCHKKCIDTHRLECYCKERPKIYYDYVPEYNENCDGNYESYRLRYCRAKRDYDSRHQNIFKDFIPEYDQLCDGSYEQYIQKQQLYLQKKQIEASQNVNMMVYPIDLNNYNTQPVQTQPVRMQQFRPVRYSY